MRYRYAVDCAHFVVTAERNIHRRLPRNNVLARTRNGRRRLIIARHSTHTSCTPADDVSRVPSSEQDCNVS